MKIFIPYRLFAVGGPITFLASLTTVLKQQGHAVTHQFSFNFDRLFIIDHCSLLYPLYANLRSKKVIQRLDGVYYPALPWPHSHTWWFKDFRKRIIHNYLADHVVYQSEFSRHACRTMLGQPRGTSSVIYNGVASGASKQFLAGSKEPIRLVNHASYRDPEQIIPLARALKHLPKNFSLTIIGPHTPKLRPLIKKLQADKRFTYKAAINRSKIREELAKYDIHAFSQLSACPNSVIEALAVGLPVVAYDRGGLKELVQSGKSGEIVPLRPHNPFYNRYKFNRKDDQAFASAVLKVSQNLLSYSRAAREAALTRFSLDKMTAAYLSILTSP
jgi:glycosyltransferase involved in cell wall biosynthesis